MQRDIIDSKDDIFYLFRDEVREIVKAGHQAQDARALVQERKDEMGRVQGFSPPDTIFGNEAPPLEPSQGEKLLGVPTSRGHYTGPARILQGLGDFGKVQDGDVLVIPYSDVGWTPLFAKAGAVVAESGGMLSHSSIIAREYGIPAVVSVAGACQIAEGTVVTVDGYRGMIKSL